MRSASFILSNSSIRHMPRSASTSAPPVVVAAVGLDWIGLVERSGIGQLVSDYFIGCGEGMMMDENVQ